MKVSSYWFKNSRDTESNEAVSNDLLASRPTMMRLKELLLEEIDDTMSGVVAQKNYKEIPNCVRLVADQFGYVRALKTLVERIPDYTSK
jgi:hypothetical protein